MMNMWKKMILLSFLLMASCYAKAKYDVAICMVFRDEAPYLKEWIEYHRLIGVQHFYLCSHNSKDDYKAILRPYIKKGIVELKELVDDPNETIESFTNNVQVSFYNESLSKAKKESHWLACLDSDEFLVPVQHLSLIDFLKDYEEFGGVVANWHMFGTSHIQRLDPSKLMIEQLICCGPTDIEINYHVKSIVQTKYVVEYKNPHFANYIPNYTQVNTNKEPFVGALSPSVLLDQLKINHYWTRDEFYFWNQKVARQLQIWGPLYAEGAKGALVQYNLESESSIQRFVLKLRKKMGLER
jgi:hypothetical protein